MTIGKLLFLLAVYLFLVAIGVAVGYFIVRFLSGIVAQHRVRKMHKQAVKQFEKLKK